MDGLFLTKTALHAFKALTIMTQQHMGLPMTRAGQQSLADLLQMAAAGAAPHQKKHGLVLGNAQGGAGGLPAHRLGEPFPHRNSKGKQPCFGKALGGCLPH